jgi:hypothetical protein
MGKIFPYHPSKRAETRRRQKKPSEPATVAPVAAPKPNPDPGKRERAVIRAEEREIMRGLIEEARAAAAARRNAAPPPAKPEAPLALSTSTKTESWLIAEGRAACRATWLDLLDRNGLGSNSPTSRSPTGWALPSASRWRR